MDYKKIAIKIYEKIDFDNNKLQTIKEGKITLKRKVVKGYGTDYYVNDFYLHNIDFKWLNKEERIELLAEEIERTVAIEKQNDIDKKLGKKK